MAESSLSFHLNRILGVAWFACKWAQRGLDVFMKTQKALLCADLQGLGQLKLCAAGFIRAALVASPMESLKCIFKHLPQRIQRNPVASLHQQY